MSPTPRKGRPAPASRTAAARTGPAVPLFAIGVAALVVIVIGAVVAIGLTGGDDEGGGGSGEVATGDQAFGPVSVTGTALEPLADGGTDPAVGQPAPVLDGETPTGDAITIDPSEGPMVIAFLAHWCPHCQSEVPRLVELADAQGEVNGVELVAVATRSDDRRPEFPPGQWLAGEDWPGRVMVDSDAPPDEAPAALAAYGVSSFPFLVAVDADGEVVARAAGEQGADGLEALFEAARAGGGEAGGTSDEGSDAG